MIEAGLPLVWMIGNFEIILIGTVRERYQDAVSNKMPQFLGSITVPLGCRQMLHLLAPPTWRPVIDGEAELESADTWNRKL